MSKLLSNFLGPVSRPTEAFIKTQPIFYTLIILYQGVFSGNAIKIPKRLETLFNSKSFRFVSLTLIALTATRDIEYALVSTFLFLILMYAIKTPEEREKTGLI
jgi:hypothetical protein